MTAAIGTTLMDLIQLIRVFLKMKKSDQTGFPRSTKKDLFLMDLRWTHGVHGKHLNTGNGENQMTDDIVDRPEEQMDFVEYLRLWASPDGNDQAVKDLHKAADEIERLRKQEEETFLHYRKTIHECNIMEQEIERLKNDLVQANNQIKLLIAIETAGRDFMI